MTKKTKLALTVKVKSSKPSHIKMNLKMSRRVNPVRLCNYNMYKVTNVREIVQGTVGRNEVEDRNRIESVVKKEDDASIDQPYNGTIGNLDNGEDSVNERRMIKRESIPNIQLTPEMLVKYNMTIMPRRFVVPKWTPMYPR